MRSLTAESPDLRLPPSLRIVGQYELLEMIGRGGTGAVYRARDPGERIVAVKVMHAAKAENATRLLRFYQEAKLAMRARCRHVIEVLEIGEDAGRHFYAMEYAERGSVLARIAALGHLPEREALQIIIRAAQAIEGLHADRIVHRDVKPSNLLLTREGRVRLSDLGYAKALDDDLNLTIHGTGLGTPQFMSPEQCRCAKEVDVTCDVYSLGATLCAMLTGIRPFRGASFVEVYARKMKHDYNAPDTLRDNVSPATCQLIRRALSPQPYKRPASARQFADEATACLAALQVPAMKVRPPQARSVVEPRPSTPAPDSAPSPAGVNARWWLRSWERWSRRLERFTLGCSGLRWNVGVRGLSLSFVSSKTR